MEGASDYDMMEMAPASASGAALRRQLHRENTIGGAERALARLEREAGLTEAGRRWLLSAVDPFHDHRYIAEDFPDGHGDTSIVQVVDRSVSISAPPDAITNGTEWDCHIYTSSLGAGGLSAYRAWRNGQQIASTTADPNAYFTNNFGMLNYACAPAGDDTLPGATTVPPLTDGSIRRGSLSPVSQPAGGISNPPDSSFLNGSSRIIAGGFEVVNETAPLYRSGQAVCYRANNSARSTYCVHDSAYVGTPVAQQIAGSTTVAAMPPCNLEEVYLLGDIVEHEAQEGAYVTLALDSAPQYQYPTGGMYMLDGRAVGPLAAPSTASSSGDAGLFVLATYDPAVIGATGSGPILKNVHTNQFATSGCYFTGLSPQTVLRLNMRLIIARRPTVKDGDLIVLSRPVAEADPLAWTLYTEARRRMRAGARLRDNAFGTWFKDVVRSVEREVLPHVGRMIVPAAHGLIAGGPKGAALAVAEEALEDIVKATRRHRGRKGKKEKGAPSKA